MELSNLQVVIKALSLGKKKKDGLGLDLGVFWHFNDGLEHGFEGNQEDISLEIRGKMSKVDDNISRIRKWLNVSLYV